MRKILLILRRECSLRLRKPSFWVLTVLVPAVLAVIYFLPVVAAQRGAGCATVMVVDQTGLFDGGLRSTDELRFHSMPSLEYARREAGRRDLILFIPSRETTIPRDAFLYYQGESPSPALQNAVSHQLQTLLQNAILEDVYQVEPSVFHSVENTALRLRVQDAATGHESFFHVKSVVAQLRKDKTVKAKRHSDPATVTREQYSKDSLLVVKQDSTQCCDSTQCQTPKTEE